MYVKEDLGPRFGECEPARARTAGGVCTTLLRSAARRIRVASLLTHGQPRHKPEGSVQPWSVVALLLFEPWAPRVVCN